MKVVREVGQRRRVAKIGKKEKGKGRGKVKGKNKNWRKQKNQTTKGGNVDFENNIRQEWLSTQEAAEESLM